MKKRRFSIQKHIHILHVATAMSWRGGEQQVAYLVEELNKKNVLQTILCSRGSEMESYCISTNTNYISRKKGSSFNILFAKTIHKICKKLEIDICHLHDAHAHTYAILATSVFNHPTPLILSRRVDFPIKKTWFSKYKYNHPAVKKILCVSDTIKKITSEGIIEQQKLGTVHSGIDLQKFSHIVNLREELNLPQETILIGNTSALADHKDYFTFVDVAEKVCQQNAKIMFVIFGKGPLESEIKQYIANKKLTNQVLLVGFRSDIAKILGDLDIFLITSKTEGLGTSIIDAFAAEVSVVATAAGGIPELVEDKKTGLLCAVKDVECLSQAVINLIANRELSMSLRHEAKRKAQEFSKSKTAEKTLRIYKEVLGLE